MRVTVGRALLVQQTFVTFRGGSGTIDTHGVLLAGPNAND